MEHSFMAAMKTYNAFIHDKDVDKFDDFMENIDSPYQSVYQLQSMPYIKFACSLCDEDLLAIKLQLSSDSYFHEDKNV